MFGFSIIKLLFTIAVVVAVWRGFKWLKRREAAADARARDNRRTESTQAREGVEEMAPCPDCGAYVAKGSGHRCT